MCGIAGMLASSHAPTPKSSIDELAVEHAPGQARKELLTRKATQLSLGLHTRVPRRDNFLGKHDVLLAEKAGRRRALGCRSVLDPLA
jgi:hypothetical protein